MTIFGSIKTKNVFIFFIYKYTGYYIVILDILNPVMTTENSCGNPVCMYLLDTLST